MKFDQLLFDTYVTRGVQEFDTNPLASTLLRRLANEGPELFFNAAIKHLESNEYGNAHRTLCIQLLRQPQLMEYLATPDNCSRETAVHLFNRFLSVDPSFDVKLARMLPGRTYSNWAEAFDALRSARALDVLDQTSRGRRLLPILCHLPDSDDPAISAKATLFVGRRVQNPTWVAKQMARPDQRVRANALEALWGVNTGAAVSLLESCVEDKNNRVVGNAVLGLHVAGRPGAAFEAMSMSRSGKPERRRTSAWLLGQIGGEEMVHRLQQLIRDEVPFVRGAALRALKELRRIEAKALESVVAKAEERTEEQIEAAVQTAQDTLQIGSISDRFLKPEDKPESGFAIRLDGSSFATRNR